MKARPSPRHPKAPPVPPHPLYLPESDEVAWSGRFALQVVRFRYRRSDGTPSALLTWEMWRRGQGVVLLPYDPRTRRVALIEQFRLPALAAGEAPVMRECPAGLLGEGEDPELAARREAEEETGLVPDRVEPIGQFMLMQGGCDERMHFYCGRVSLPEAGLLGLRGLEAEGEETRILVLPLDEALAQLARNEIRNVTAAMSLLWLQVNAPRLDTEWMD
ncbi:NUDIX domain-containing protein [Teichococcus aestuarii]|uniref:GDP-mannose pyrophosphatase n=1 Tax=Teichococcus aestuarii TaxID=568898 RepID=A0A2U1V8Z2_9PROT|nr:NUDIX domain-containing protein [Pseudoroseomonas aestuarii]PWC30380.1 ADP-ribose diphosphatase [Pseudoroseomonas aestuarii]